MGPKIISLNTKGLNHPAKRASPWKSAIDLGGNIICVQETHFKSTEAPKCSHRTFPHVFMANSPEKKRGVLIAIRDTVTFQLLDRVIDHSDRYVILICKIDDRTYTLVALYVPNLRQVHFLNKLIKRTK